MENLCFLTSAETSKVVLVGLFGKPLEMLQVLMNCFLFLIIWGKSWHS